MESKTEKWTTVGFCGVDSGMILMIDPCYIKSEINLEHLDAMYRLQSEELYGTMPYDHGVAVSSGLGDGVYPVQVRHVDLGLPWGRRVAEVRIVFIEDSPEIPTESSTNGE